MSLRVTQEKVHTFLSVCKASVQKMEINVSLSFEHIYRFLDIIMVIVKYLPPFRHRSQGRAGR